MHINYQGFPTKKNSYLPYPTFSFAPLRALRNTRQHRKMSDESNTLSQNNTQKTLVPNNAIEEGRKQSVVMQVSSKT
jgi:hypothetical protein